MTHLSSVAKPRTFLFMTLLAALCALVFAGAASAEFPTIRSTPGWSGTPQEGFTLQGSNGQWLYANGLKCEPGDCTYRYTWQRCNADTSGCADIPGATSHTYLLVAADVGKRLRFIEWVSKRDCDAHGLNCQFVEKNGASSPTPPVAPKPIVVPTSTARPTVTGTAMEDELLTAHNGTWSGPEPITKAFQWERCDAGGANCNAIAGGTEAVYRLTLQDVGFKIRVAEIARNAGGVASAYSDLTQTVIELKPTAQRQVIPVTKVTGNHRLVVDRITLARVATATFTIRIRIRDDRGFRIAGALVQTQVIPETAVVPLRETRSGADGWATFTFRVTKTFRGGTLWFYVTARKPGALLQTGASTSNLFKLKIPARPKPAKRK